MRHNKINFLGRFKSLAHVWMHYPCGGHKGDWLSVGHDNYIWNDEQHNWTLDTYANSDSYALLHQTGDLMLMGNLHVGGHTVVRQKAVFKDDVTIEGELHCRHIKGKDRGLYASYEDLIAACPAPHTGDWALVGANATPQLWGCRQHRQWQLEGSVSLFDTFNLDGYNLARSIVEDIAAMGYVFEGVADITTNPHTPHDYNVMYLTSEPGCYVNFDNIQVRYLSALMWDHNPALPGGGQWRAHAIMGNVFVDTDNIAHAAVTTEKIADGAVTTEKIADGAVTLDKTTGVTSYVDEMIGLEAQARASALNDINSRLSRLDADAVKSVSVNNGAKKFPDAEGNVHLVVPQGGEGGDSPADVEIGENSVTIDGTEVQFKTVNGHSLIAQGGSDSIVIEGGGGPVFPNNTKNVVYPEAYNAKGDGIDFYNWPLACFGGILDTVVVPISTTLDKTVPLPSERLWGDIGNIAVNENTGALVYSEGNYGLSLTAADVVYSTANHKFLLHYGDNYYSNWNNSGVWNTPDGYPRTDTVYSDISPVAEVGDYNREGLEDLMEGLQGKRVSYVYKPESGTDVEGNTYNAGTLVNIDRLMHNDLAAFRQWLSKAEEGYSLRLTKGKIYYIKIPHATWGSSWTNNPLHTFGNDSTPIDYNNAEIDFGGAVLFLRLDDPWFPHATKYNGSSYDISEYDTQGLSVVFQIKGSKNLTFKNLTVRAMRDRDGGCVGKNCRLSSSDSALMLFKFSSTNSASICSENIRIENLDVTNMTRDFEAEPSNKNMLASLEIDGWKSDGVAWNGIRARNVIIRNADVVTAKYLGGCGYHVFYMKDVENFICSDSSFRHPDTYNEPMVSYGTGYDPSTSPLTFINCTFDLVYFGYTKNVRFIDCKMIQKYAYYMASGKTLQPFNSSGGYLNMDDNKTELFNCIAYLSHHHLTKNGTNNLLLDNVTVFTTETFAKKIFQDYSGSAVVRNFKTNYAGTIGINVTDYEKVQRDALATELNGRMDDIDNVITGGLQIIQGDPLAPAEDDEWYNSVVEEARRCTAEGEAATIKINIRKYADWPTASEFTGQTTIHLNAVESIIFNWGEAGSGVSTLAQFKDILDNTLGGAPYFYDKAVDLADCCTGEGKYFYSINSGNTAYLYIRTKKHGPGYSSWGSITDVSLSAYDGVYGSNSSSDSTHSPVYRNSACGIYDNESGTAFTFEAIQSGGFVPRIGELEKSTGMVCVPKTWGSLAPSPAAKGDYWYDDVNGLKRHNGTGFVAVDTDGELRVIYNTTNSKLYLAIGGVISKEITLETI